MYIYIYIYIYTHICSHTLTVPQRVREDSSTGCGLRSSAESKRQTAAFRECLQEACFVTEISEHLRKPPFPENNTPVPC